MPETNLFLIFTSRLQALGVPYMVTGSVASIVYGEPRLTHDVDLVIDLPLDLIEKLVAAFPPADFYLPPREIIAVECRRPQRGHFNIIHHESGFKADVYAAGREEIHAWALARVRTVSLDGIEVRIAPPEYVILRKLQYYREGGSEKHLRDLRAMLQISGDDLDRVALEQRVRALGLEREWRLVCGDDGPAPAVPG